MSPIERDAPRPPEPGEAPVEGAHGHVRRGRPSAIDATDREEPAQVDIGREPGPRRLFRRRARILRFGRL